MCICAFLLFVQILFTMWLYGMCNCFKFPVNNEYYSNSDSSSPDYNKSARGSLMQSNLRSLYIYLIMVGSLLNTCQQSLALPWSVPLATL